MAFLFAAKKKDLNAYLLNNSYFLRSSRFSRLFSRVLRGSCNGGHHDGYHVLVNSQDVDQVRMLEEDVVVHQGPVKNNFFDCNVGYETEITLTPYF